MLNPNDCTLYSGAAAGAEAAFGAAAERYGVTEVNYTFEGHGDARARGLHILTPDELRQGDVSLRYVGHLMNRVYKDTPMFRRILQSIWHQINSGQDVYVIGTILPDGHVKGGTGWGAEFAKLCNKPLLVFDQEREDWYRWQSGGSWHPEEDPKIEHQRFTGTGTRMLTEAGRQAVDALFAATFG